jgi:hypothetical protein
LFDSDYHNSLATQKFLSDISGKSSHQVSFSVNDYFFFEHYYAL